jgi:toxin ParE1/3/4
MKPVGYHPLARSEMEEVALYYEERRPGLGDRFDMAVTSVENLLSENPQIGQPHKRGTRKFKVRGFPYALIYREQKDQIVIVAVAHFRRKPGYWANRVGR